MFTLAPKQLLFFRKFWSSIRSVYYAFVIGYCRSILFPNLLNLEISMRIATLLAFLIEECRGGCPLLDLPDPIWILHEQSSFYIRSAFSPDATKDLLPETKILLPEFEAEKVQRIPTITRWTKFRYSCYFQKYINWIKHSLVILCRYEYTYLCYIYVNKPLEM